MAAQTIDIQFEAPLTGHGLAAMIGEGGAAGGSMGATKDIVLRILEIVPDDAEIEDVIEELYFVRKLQIRLEDAGNDEKLTHEEVFRKMERRLIELETEAQSGPNVAL